MVWRRDPRSNILNLGQTMSTPWIWYIPQQAPLAGHIEEIGWSKMDPTLQKYNVEMAAAEKAAMGPGQRRAAHDKAVDTAIGLAGAAMPAWRLEEGLALAVREAMPMLKKLWPKVMAKFANLLTKAKGNPEALTKIATRFEDDMWGMMLRPSQLEKSNPNYLNNINEMSSFKSKQIPEKQFTSKEKIDNRLGNKTPYELREMDKRAASASQAPENKLDLIPKKDFKWKDYESYKRQWLDKNNLYDPADDVATIKASMDTDLENSKRVKEGNNQLKSENDFLKNKNNQRRKQFDKLPEDIKKNILKNMNN